MQEMERDAEGMRDRILSHVETIQSQEIKINDTITQMYASDHALRIGASFNIPLSGTWHMSTSCDAGKQPRKTE